MSTEYMLCRPVPFGAPASAGTLYSYYSLNSSVSKVASHPQSNLLPPTVVYYTQARCGMDDGGYKQCKTRCSVGSWDGISVGKGQMVWVLGGEKCPLNAWKCDDDKLHVPVPLVLKQILKNIVHILTMLRLCQINHIGLLQAYHMMTYDVQTVHDIDNNWYFTNIFLSHN